jgi:microsomal epoxide hydrolase
MRYRFTLLTKDAMRTITIALLLYAIADSAVGQQRSTESYVRTSDGVRLHYIEGGNGPAILFIPGFTGAAQFWERQIRQFSTTHRVIAMSPRSQGDSDKTQIGNFTERRAADIKNVVDSLHLAPVVIVAWSRAVAETLSYVQQFGSDTIRAVVLVDGPIVQTANEKRLRDFIAEAAEIQKNRRAYTDKSARSMFERPHSEAFFRGIIEANLKTPDAVTVVLQVDFLQFDYRPALRKVNRPLMFASRGSTPTAQAKVVASEVPAARIETFPGSGHALFLDDPERFNAVLTDFPASYRRASARGSSFSDSKIGRFNRHFDRPPKSFHQIAAVLIA